MSRIVRIIAISLAFASLSGCRRMMIYPRPLPAPCATPYEAELTPGQCWSRIGNAAFLLGCPEPTTESKGVCYVPSAVSLQ